jgi:ABC-type sugar transport system permease subunit
MCTHRHGINEKKFIGINNYINLFANDPTFLIALKNNLIWIILTLLCTTTTALMFAVILNKKFRGRTFFRAFFYFPCIIAPIAVSIIWRWIYNPNIGFINQICETLGINFSQSWLSDPKVSIFAIFAAALWQGVGQPMILFLAGLQSVSVDVLEAATIDGANGARKFLNITIPLMKETFIIVFATQVVAALKVFDIVQGLTGGGPNNATQMLSTYMYAQTFQYNNAGIGSAIACVMVMIMMLVIVPYVNYSAKEN